MAIVRRQRQHSVVVGNSAIKIALRVEGVTARAKILEILWVDGNGAAVIEDRLVKIALGPIDIATGCERLRNRWLKGDCDVTLGYRPVHMNTLSNEVQSFPPKARVY